MSELPADQLAEKAIRAHRVRQERTLYGLVGQLSEKLPDMDPPEIMRTVTAWTGKDGKQRGGIMRPELLSDERLAKSIEDAQGWLEDMGGGVPAGSRA